MLSVDAVHDGRRLAARADKPHPPRAQISMGETPWLCVQRAVRLLREGVRILPLGQRARARAAARAAAAAAAPAGAPHVRAALLGAGVAFMLSVSLDTRLQ